MYEDQTYEAILARMLTNISNDIDKREGSLAFDMLAPKAAELAVSYLELNNVLTFGFAGTTYGEFLDLKVAEAGIIRFPATPSKGSVNLTGTDEGMIIPLGMAIYTDTGIRFLTDTVATITGGTATVNITAETAGLSGNVPANSIINCELDNISCNNISPTLDGTDIEADDKLLLRYYQKVQTPSVSGNKYQYQQWALEIPGIGDARIIPLWNGDGTVKVVLIGLNKDIVGPDKVTEVNNHIIDKAPIGATVTVESATELPINVSTTLTLQNGILITDIQPTIELNLTNYFKSATFVDSDIKYSRIGTSILQVDGVVDYSNLTINGGTANIPISDIQIPVLGVVTLS